MFDGVQVQGLDQGTSCSRMLLRKYTFVRLFATSLALASQGGSVAPNQTQWQSGDCIDKKIDEREGTRMSHNEPYPCINWCNWNGFKFSAVNKDWCACANEVPGNLRIDNEECKIPCPGNPNSVCGGGNQWWNVFPTHGKLFNFYFRSGLMFQ